MKKTALATGTSLLDTDILLRPMDMRHLGTASPEPPGTRPCPGPAVAKEAVGTGARPLGWVAQDAQGECQGLAPTPGQETPPGLDDLCLAVPGSFNSRPLGSWTAPPTGPSRPWTRTRAASLSGVRSSTRSWPGVGTSGSGTLLRPQPPLLPH